MKITAARSPKEYIADIKSRLDSPFLWGQERFTGFCFGPFFSVSYSGGKEFGRIYQPVMNKAAGIVKTVNGETTVRYIVFRGCTAPVPLAVLFLLSFLIFKIVDVPGAVLFAAGWTLAAALLTFLVTLLSEEGRNGTAALERFLSSCTMPK